MLFCPNRRVGATKVVGLPHVRSRPSHPPTTTGRPRSPIRTPPVTQPLTHEMVPLRCDQPNREHAARTRSRISTTCTAPGENGRSDLPRKTENSAQGDSPVGLRVTRARRDAGEPGSIGDSGGRCRGEGRGCDRRHGVDRLDGDRNGTRTSSTSPRRFKLPTRPRRGRAMGAPSERRGSSRHKSQHYPLAPSGMHQPGNPSHRRCVRNDGAGYRPRWGEPR